MRRVRHVTVGIGDNRPEDGAESGLGGSSKGNGFPCRILVELKGLEWFIYNRSPAYDYVMEQMAEANSEGDSRGNGYRVFDEPLEAAESPGEDASTLKGSRLKARAGSVSARRASAGSLMGDNDHTGSRLMKGHSVEEEGLTLMLRIFPIKVEVNRGAIVVGNNNIPSILVGHFEKAEAYIDATRVCTLSVSHHEPSSGWIFAV